MTACRVPPGTVDHPGVDPGALLDLDRPRPAIPGDADVLNEAEALSEDPDREDHDDDKD
jgi:hypothetical protein